MTDGDKIVISSLVTALIILCVVLTDRGIKYKKACQNACAPQAFQVVEAGMGPRFCMCKNDSNWVIKFHHIGDNKNE